MASLQLHHKWFWQQSNEVGDQCASCLKAVLRCKGVMRTWDVLLCAGTLFLWMFWPSFNGALASIETMDTAAAGVEAAANAAFAPQQYYCVTNTLISLLGSCIAAFGVTAAVNDAFDMMHIQVSGPACCSESRCMPSDTTR